MSDIKFVSLSDDGISTSLESDVAVSVRAPESMSEILSGIIIGFASVDFDAGVDVCICMKLLKRYSDYSNIAFKNNFVYG